MSLHLIGMGTAVPEGTASREEGLAVARAFCPSLRESTWLPAVYHQTGIDKRHQTLGSELLADLLNGTEVSDSPFLPQRFTHERGPSTAQRMQIYSENAPKLALEASRKALAESRTDPQSIRHLITVSCTGFLAPGIDTILMKNLGLSPRVERTHIGFMGCHAALNGLRVADAFVRADPKAKVLLAAVELCSLHFNFTNDPEKQVANALFADGAAALVGENSEADDSWQVRSTGSCLLPNSQEAMSWSVGDHGFEMTLSRKIPGIIAKHLRPWLEDWLAQSGFSLNQIRSWAVHPGGPRILSAVEEGLNFSVEELKTSRQIFREFGNMSSPTVLFILQRLREQNAPRPCVTLGFGPGMVVEGALLV